MSPGLGIEAESMRALGYRVVDLVVAHLSGLRDGPALATTDPGPLEHLLGGPIPEEPGDLAGDIELIAHVVLATMQHGDHPRYFARVPGPAAYPGILGDWLATGTQAIAASWAGGAGPSAVELIGLRWLSDALGMPPATEGILQSGGSLANLTCLLAARAEQGPGAVYCSDQTHSSILRNLRALGEPSVRVLRAGAGLRLDPDDVERAVAADRRAGIVPSIVVATAGTTNTGAVDPLEALAAICRREGMWLHVDGAYGAPAALCSRGREQLGPLSMADSLVVDPHKWLFQPYDIACAFVRRPGALDRAFTMNPEYLHDVTAQAGEVDLRNRGLELTRRARGIKLWLTFRAYGRALLSEAVAAGIETAEYAEGRLRRDSMWEIVTPAQLGIVTFAAHGRTADELSAAAAALTDDGYAALTTTTLQGRSVLRLCTINPETTADDIDGTIDRLAAYLARG